MRRRLTILWLRRVVRPVLHATDPPEAVARGAALGTFLGMTPTLGIQMAMAWVLAFPLRANKVAALACTWISNPATVFFIYFADYWLGARLLGQESLMSYEQVRDIFDDDFMQVLSNVAAAGWAFITAALLGGAVLGALVATPVYPLVRAAVVRRRRRRASRETRRAEERATAYPPADES